MPERRDTRRRFEQWARNPDCMANTISAVHGIPMAEVAKILGIEPSTGQSPFAIARGQRFERSLFENGAERLLKELIERGLLGSDETRFRDLRLRMLGGESPTLNHALEETLSLIHQIARASAQDRRKLPSLVAGATLRIPGGVMLPEAIVVIDALLVRQAPERPELMVGEIKTYPDRGGYTDRAELATARAQAGVYVHGLEAVLLEQDLQGRIALRLEGFFVLSRPGFNVPSIRSGEDLRYQVERARRGFARLRDVAARVGINGGDPAPETVATAECSYSESCVSFCDLAPRCYEQAVERGNPVVLGEEVARFLGPVDLKRTCELLDGAPAITEAEADLRRRLSEIREIGDLA